MEEFYEALEGKYKARYLREPLREEVAAVGPVRGKTTAPVTIVIFSEFECPYCAEARQTLDEVLAEFGDQVRLVFRQFPLRMHRNAQKAAEAALCADDQGKFWQMHDALFRDRTRLGIADLKKTAAAVGLDAVKFETCLDSGTMAPRVSSDVRAGSAIGVSGTPSIFVNGRFVARSLLASVVRDELKRIAHRQQPEA